MKVIFLGDISWKIGREAVAHAVPSLRSQYAPDIIIANVENAAHGTGIEKRQYDYFKECGIDAMTSGDHVFDKSKVDEIFSSPDCVLVRPANYPARADVPGKGCMVVQSQAGPIGIINLQGRVFMSEGMDNPFWVIKDILTQPELQGIPIIVDFHGEATSEKVAMGWMLDGAVSAVVGTHTHVQTNDARILPNGTAYITDVGMCGPQDGVLGVDKNIIISRFLDALPSKFDQDESKGMVNGMYIEIDGIKAVGVEPISLLLDR